MGIGRLSHPVPVPNGTSVLALCSEAGVAMAASGRAVEGGALYTVQERVDTFQSEHWPFDSGPCTAVKMAEAGFYFCGSESSPDWVRCVVCHHDLDGWEPEDNPLEEHRRHCPKCPLLKLRDPYLITLGDVITLEKKALEFHTKVESKYLREELQSMVSGLVKELATQQRSHDDVTNNS